MKQQDSGNAESRALGQATPSKTAAITPEEVMPRIIWLGGGDVRAQHGTLVQPLVGSLGVGFAADKGPFFIHLNEELRAAAGFADDAALYEQALLNLQAAVAEGGINVQFNAEQTIGFVLLDPDLTSTSMLLDTFWGQIDEHLGGDVIAVVPSRRHLAFGKMTGVGVYEELAKYCAWVKASVEAEILFDDTVYKWGGAGVGWEV